MSTPTDHTVYMLRAEWTPALLARQAAEGDPVMPNEHPYWESLHASESSALAAAAHARPQHPDVEFVVTAWAVQK